jgi:heme-degrading monooxygenase HmoA
MPDVENAPMPHVISIHDYVLRPDVDAQRFEHAVRRAHDLGLFRLPGLIAYHFARGIKGARRGSYTAIWIYESRQAWEALWGAADHPRSAQDHPASWRTWEDEILAPLLSQAPDTITFTAYEAWLSARTAGR